ncbi:MAG: LytTR family transcriptional regulator DNA-binding domain-containing protein [Candidatus Latescibacterota bacterium]|nr:MAG: LytTR family transcriptional regulator DNA-binding domain-containing protein [Candidatus Latescibacterota bacterium]
MAARSLRSRVLLHVSKARRVALDPHSVYYLEADGGDTVVRSRGRRTRRDLRPLQNVAALFEPHGFYRVHDKWSVNVQRIREMRLQRDGVDWEVVIHPPVNRVIPVSRSRLRGLLRLFGE